MTLLNCDVAVVLQRVHRLVAEKKNYARRTVAAGCDDLEQILQHSHQYNVKVAMILNQIQMLYTQLRFDTFDALSFFLYSFLVYLEFDIAIDEKFYA